MLFSAIFTSLTSLRPSQLCLCLSSAISTLALVSDCTESTDLLSLLWIEMSFLQGSLSHLQLQQRLPVLSCLYANIAALRARRFVWSRNLGYDIKYLNLSPPPFTRRFMTSDSAYALLYIIIPFIAAFAAFVPFSRRLQPNLSARAVDSTALFSTSFTAVFISVGDEAVSSRRCRQSSKAVSDLFYGLQPSLRWKKQRQLQKPRKHLRFQQPFLWKLPSQLCR